MAKKISKDLMEALKTAKSPEDVTKILGAEGFDIPELSLEDLDTVSGGQYASLVDVPGDWYSPEFGMTGNEFAAIIDMLYNGLGRDVTLNWLQETYGVPVSDSKNWFNPPGLDAGWLTNELFSMSYKKHK